MMEKLVLVQKAISKVFGDFVAKAVSDGVDALKDAIRDADLDRKSYNQNMQTRLYQLTVDALNRFTYNKYEKQDKLYAAAESILKGYISTKDDIDAVKLGLKMLVSDVNSDTCQDFLEILCGEICRDDNSDLYKEFDMLWKRQESEHFRGEFAKVNQNDREILEQLNDLKEVLDFIKRNMNRQEDKLGHNGIPIVNRADEYAKKWDKNVFLNDFNKRDENAKDKVNIKLSDIYLEEQLPHYKWRKNKKNSYDLRNLLNEYIEKSNEKKMLLILGQPGIGKSTLITWMMANLVEKNDDILVYQFALDLGSVNWKNGNILENIFRTFGLESNELEGKTVILDGFDEIYINDDRERVLNKLDKQLKALNSLQKFSLIITCRENYIDPVQLSCDYIILQAWDKDQIESFCEIYKKVNSRKESKSLDDKSYNINLSKILDDEEIFGIPLILYMILALNVDVEKSSSLVDIYDQIFSLKKGGIYDRCYDVEHRINAPEIKEHIHRISQRIAFWIFENNADKAFIPWIDFEDICDNEMSELGRNGIDIQNDTLIGNFFKLKHCEGIKTDELHFIHRSIYEYFVVIFFFESIHKVNLEEKIAENLGEFLKKGHLSKQILEFIKYKFDSKNEFAISDIIGKGFRVMLQDDMTYHMKEKNKNIINQELNIFSNMLNLVHLWFDQVENIDNKLTAYLRHNDLERLDLRGAALSGTNLRGVFLIGANLSGAYLIDTDLNRAVLEDTNLRGAHLNGADLSGTDLNGADLRGAFLIEAYLDETDLNGADLRGVNLGRAKLGRVNLFKADLERTIFSDKQVDMLYKRYDLSKSCVLLPKTGKIISYSDYIR